MRVEGTHGSNCRNEVAGRFSVVDFCEDSILELVGSISSSAQSAGFCLSYADFKDLLYSFILPSIVVARNLGES